MASKVLPQPALPHTSVVRPFGSPPPVTSSSPSIPVGVFGSGVRDVFNLAWGIARQSNQSFRFWCQRILTKRGTRPMIVSCLKAGRQAALVIMPNGGGVDRQLEVE